MKSVVTIGGGTGQFTLLSGLKKYPVNLTAVVSMADDGGSTGMLRDELGVLPPGDIRQCLVALSEADLIMRDPTQPDAIWSLLDTLKPVERLQAAEIIKALKRTGTTG